MEMKENKVEERVIEIIDKLRPFLMNDGGNIEFIKYEDNIVYITLHMNLDTFKNDHSLPMKPI